METGFGEIFGFIKYQDQMNLQREMIESFIAPHKAKAKSLKKKHKRAAQKERNAELREWAKLIKDSDPSKSWADCLAEANDLI